MRRHGLPNPYEQLKALTRGHGIDADAMRTFVASLDLPADARARLAVLTPAGYIGLGRAAGPRHLTPKPPGAPATKPPIPAVDASGLGFLDRGAAPPCDILTTPRPSARGPWSRSGPGATTPLASTGACRAHAAQPGLDTRLADDGIAPAR